MKFLPVLAAVVLSGCAATPQEMAQQSNFDVCRFTMGGPHSQIAHNEMQRRKLDCAPYYPAIAAQQANQNAALQNFINATQKPAAAPPRPPVSCTSRRTGNTVQTDCW